MKVAGVDFAVPDGATSAHDCAPAIQAVLNAYHSVLLPARANPYILNTPLTFKGHGQMIVGDGPGRASQSPTGVVGSVLKPLSAEGALRVGQLIQHNRIAHLRIDGSAMTSGAALNVIGRAGAAAGSFTVDNVRIVDPWVGAYVRRFNTVLFHDVQMIGVRGPYGWQVDGTGPDYDSRRGDVIRLDGAMVSFAASQQQGTAMLVDGEVHTILLEHFITVKPWRALHIANSGNLPYGDCPAFLVAIDFQCDFPTDRGVLIESLASGKFIGSYVHGSMTSHCVDIAPVGDNPDMVQGIRFIGTKLSGAALCNVRALCRDVEFVTCDITGQGVIRDETGAMTNKWIYPAVLLREGTGRAVFVGGQQGTALGAPSHTRDYGIHREHAATEVGLVGARPSGRLGGTNW